MRKKTSARLAGNWLGWRDPVSRQAVAAPRSGDNARFIRAMTGMRTKRQGADDFTDQRRA